MEKFEQQAVLSQPYSYSSNAQPCRRKSAGGWEHGPPLDKRTDKPCYAPTVHVHDPLANGHDAIKIIPGVPAQLLIKTRRATVAWRSMKPLLARRSFLPSSSSVHWARTFLHHR
jgi:hypothetical protein